MINSVKTFYQIQPGFSSEKFIGGKIGIVDCFEPSDENKRKVYDLNDDGINDVAHGHLVKAALLASRPSEGLGLPEIHFNPRWEYFNYFIEFNKNKKLDEQINWVVRTRGESVDLECKDDISRVGQKNLRDLREIEEFIQKYNKKVYTSAGNITEPGKIFCTSLAQGVVSVGGLNPYKDNEIPGICQWSHESSGNNYGPFLFEGELVKNKKNGEPLGYDIYPKGRKPDGKIDLDLSDPTIKISNNIFIKTLKGKGGIETLKPKIELMGNSFAAPYKLGKDYQAQQAGYKEWNPFTDSYV